MVLNWIRNFQEELVKYNGKEENQLSTDISKSPKMRRSPLVKFSQNSVLSFSECILVSAASDYTL